MCIWLPLLLMLGAAILGWFVGKDWLRSKVEELEGNVEEHKKLYSVMRTENADTKLKFNTLNSSYNILEKERDNLNYSISDLKVQMERDRKESDAQFGMSYSSLKEEFDFQKATWTSQMNDLQKQLDSKAEEHLLLLGQYNEKPKEVEVIKEVEVVKEIEVVKEVEVIKEVEVVKEVEVIKEVEVVKEIEIIKEVPVEIIKEVEVVKSLDFDMLRKMMEEMETVEVSRTVTDIEARAATVLAAAPIKKDDLKKIEGVGPKIEQLLNDVGIITFLQLSESNVDELREILIKAGSRFKMHDPGTWSEQAKLAAAEKWEELGILQNQLNGGR